MKKIITCFLLLFAVGKIGAQTFAPIATSGYTLDAIAESTTALSTTAGPIDGSDFVLFSAAYGVQAGSIYGLPNSGVIGTGAKTFQLQNYANTPNVLYILGSGIDSLTVLNPVACYSLSLLGFATEGPGTMSVTVRFTDNTTQSFGGIALYDWFNTVPTPFYNGFDRVGRLNGTLANVGGAGNPRMYAPEIAFTCANQSKKIKRIIVKNSSTARLCILAASAYVSPLTVTATPVNLCNSGTVTFTAAGSTSYSWQPVGNFAASNATIVTANPTVTTEYTVQATSPSNCILSAMVSINVYTTVPSLTVANTAPAGICPTRTVNLTASGATTYTWTGGSTTVTNGVTFVPSATVDYTVTGTNACGNSSAVSSVSLYPLPTIIPAASSSSLCSGNSVTLTATGSATAFVFSGPTGTLAGGTGFSPVLTATYTVIGTSALSCTAAATIPVTVVTTPVLAPTTSTALNCIGNSVTLTAIGATNYTWTSATQTVFTSTLVATPSTTGVSTYTVTKSNSNCVDTKVISITTNSLPTIFAIASPTLVCALNPATLSIGGGQTYTWTSPGPPTFTFSGPNPVVHPPVSTNYTVAASDGTCIARTTVSVSANPNPTILATPAHTAICDGQSLTVNVTGGINYTWTSTSGATFNNTMTITETPTATVAYNVTGDNSFGCISSDTKVVLVNPNPTITITSNKTLVCSGSPATLTASGADTYTWTGNPSLTNTAVVNPVSLVSGPVIHTAIGAYTTGCSGTKTFAVNVFVPVLSVSGTTNACAGGVVTLIGGGGNNGTYTWTTSNGTSNFQTLNATLTAAGIFTLDAKTTSITTICPATKTVAVGIFANPVITAVAQRTTICTKESVQLYGGGGVSYTWNNAMQGGTITVTPLVQTNYTVTGTDANGCVSTGTVQVKLSGCVGIGEINSSANAFVIYPNPNNGEFTIRTSSDITLTLMNELGQVINTYSLSGINGYKASVSGLANGIYFISGQKDSVKVNQKIVVTK